jgi:predicted  nucleic acid-binding Zn-ribbon protein
MDLKTALQSLRQYKLPRTRALEQELESVRAEHEAVSAQLDEVRGEFAHAHDSDLQQITLLQSRLRDIEFDRNAARQQVQTLEQSLEAVREEFERAHSNDSKQISALQSQLVQIESDRNNARQQAQLLEGALTQATQRQETTEQRLRALEEQLEQARGRHETELSLARETLAGLQSEQRGLLEMQSEMTRNFSDASHVLVKSVQAVSRPSLWQVVLIACLLFLSGALATALVLHESREPSPDLSGISGGIDDLQLMMQAHFRTHEELLETLTRLVGGLSAPAQEPPVAPVPDVLEPEDEVPLDVLPEEQVRKMQENLLTLGFDIGPSGVDGVRGARTGRALGWFRTLYLPDSPEASMQELQSTLQYHADLARADAEKYGLDSDVTAAIRLGSLRTGIELPYLMELAAVESSFNPRAQAGSTSAAGLYQFKEETWLEAIRRHGETYGLGRYARAVEFTVDEDGQRRPQIHDLELHRQVLDLRFNPALSALLAAEKVRDGKRRLSGKLEREPGRADLYLTHFFGMTGALSFLEALAKSPDRVAGEIFPGPARRNRNIFQRSNRTLRTVAEVYRLLERKFNTSRYEDG